MRFRKDAILTPKEKFQRVYRSRYFQNHLKNKNICPLDEDYVYEFIKPHIDLIPNNPTKKHFEMLIGAFIICDLDNISHSIEYVIKTKKEDQKGRDPREYWKNIYGLEYAEILIDNYNNRLKKRPKQTQEQRKQSTVFGIKFWLKQGYSEEESKNKVYEMQSSNANKRDKSSYKNRENYNGCIEYWLKKGYSEEEAEEKRLEAVEQMSAGLKGMIHRYGEEEGKKRYKASREKFKKSMRDENGNWRGFTAGISKESLKFFLPIYRWLRKNGIERNDIFWGIGGSKEYFLHHPDGSVRLYDFTIRSLGVIIEYHGGVWHPIAPFEIEGRRLAFGDHHESYYRDIDKKNLAMSKGFRVYPIWSDETNKHEKIINILRKHLHE